MIENFVKNNKIITVLFLFSTIFFIYQRLSGGVHWDFALYVSNARYFFNNGFYLEWWVPPLTPFLLGLFSIFSWTIAEYSYIMFVSALFLFSCLKFSETFKIDKTIFYAAFINAYTLYYGLRNGTELLSLSLLSLFFAYLFEKRREVKSSFFLSLSFLARYNNIFLLPFILFKRNLKIILYNFLIFLIVLTPWFLFNYIATGNFFKSVSDYYVLVSLQRLFYGNEMLSYLSLMIAVSSAILFVIFREKISKIASRNDLTMIFLFLLLLLAFLNMPFRDPRYLFSISLPVIYFFVKMTKFKKILYPLIIFNIVFIATIIPYYFYSEDAYFKNFKIQENCTLMSNAWVYFDYHGTPTEPYPRRELINNRIEEGYRILLFKWIVEPDYAKNETFLSQFPIIENTTIYILLGNKSVCKEFYKINTSFTERRNEFSLTQNITLRDELGCNKNIISENICNILKV